MNGSGASIGTEERVSGGAALAHACYEQVLLVPYTSYYFLPLLWGPRIANSRIARLTAKVPKTGHIVFLFQALTQATARRGRG